MTEDQIVAITMLCTLGATLVLIAALVVNIEFDTPTPFSNDALPPYLNALIFVFIWLPLVTVAVIVAVLIRLAIPARKVNTSE